MRLQISRIIIPASFLLFKATSIRYTPHRSHLLHTSLAWAAIALYLSLRLGLRRLNNSVDTSTPLWVIGILLIFGEICSRIAGSAASYSWVWSFLPAVICWLQQTSFGAYNTSYSIIADEKLENNEKGHPWPFLVFATATSFMVLATTYVRAEGLLLGAIGVLSTSMTWVLLSKRFEESDRQDDIQAPNARQETRRCSWLPRCSSSYIQHSVRDLAVLVSFVTLILSVLVEYPYLSSMTTYPTLAQIKSVTGLDWTSKLLVDEILWLMAGTMIEFGYIVSLLSLLASNSLLTISLLYLGGVISRTFTTDFSPLNLNNLFICVIYLVAALYTLMSKHFNTAASTSKRYGHLLPWASKRNKAVSGLAISFGCILVGRAILIFAAHPTATGSTSSTFNIYPPLESLGPVPVIDHTRHPMEQLIHSSQAQFEDILSKQSKSLGQAVSEYKKRYGISPPPRFEVWYEFARERNVPLIDEFDTIHEALTPFWALEPFVLRSRVSEVLGFENSLLAVLIRDGRIQHVEGSNSSSTLQWHEESLLRMMDSFIGHLPDMDLAFNLHDEPRVILPHDILSRMVNTAKTEAMPAAARSSETTNEFSSRPDDMTAGNHIPEMRATRFNRFARQHTWSHSRLSCSPDAPSRDITDSLKDNITAFAAGDLGFIYNTTAFSDICQTPSLRGTFGFFDRPNVFNIIQDLVPIFSQSKISSFQDILYPSPWYWADKVPYDAASDPDWESKNATLYWRGSTTGGFSRKGGWRRQHRQRIVSNLNAQGTATVLHKAPGSEEWTNQTVNRHDYASLIDVSFSHIGQCDPSDCRAQHEFFHVVPAAPQSDAWSSRLLLDMDGNAFSGRFIAFLRSKSLVLKMAVFREWHAEWIKPWVHYVPLSLRGDEWLETTRYLLGDDSGTGTGEELGKRVAEQGREWAQKSLRKEDMEVWFFRLLLEYGRLIDDRRAEIGFAGT
ncbi:hypothetical protein BT63DRAFT_456026 [Microthyrium microscopicum]|uniref:Glycosyl transferase CAP10 domain-containing protein n=1 Tax=Microthyrium microscopicum TaxID=703497 RepID=A0A6A6U801_9PEZI|nr:hypothetical protein BT63DRAFT_456026 [Microthyrium microscopicum]